MQGAGTDSVLQTLLKIGNWAHKPLEDWLRDLEVQVGFVYGQYDWNDASPAMELSKEMWMECWVWVLPESDHLLYVDNSDGLTDVILKELGTESFEFPE